MCLTSVGSGVEVGWAFGEPISTDPAYLKRFIKLDQTARSLSSRERAGLDQIQTDRGRSYAERAERQGWGSCAAQVGGGGVVCRPEVGGVGG
jgi:hypothetical protein